MPEDCSRQRRVERSIGAVISEVLTAVRSSGADETTRARLRALIDADESVLRSSLAEFGIDSLSWMAVLTVLEEKFDILFPDDLAADPQSYTVLGLSGALSDCLGEAGEIPRRS